MFPYADDRTLKLAEKHGLPSTAADLAQTVDNDKHKFVQLLAALIRASLRKVPIDDEEGIVEAGESAYRSVYIRQHALEYSRSLWDLPSSGCCCF